MNTNPNVSELTRRAWLRLAIAGGSLVTLEGVVPGVLLDAAEATKRDDRVLIVLEMAGGNDGLNMVIPHADEAYRKARPEIGIAPTDTLTITPQIGLHPSLRGMADLLEQGQLAIVQGVGYPEPNRSHFESMDIWHTCQQTRGSKQDGWLGRCLETQQIGQMQDPPALHLGSENQPLALTSRGIRVPSIETLEQFRLQGVDRPELVQAIGDLSRRQRESDNDLLDFVQSSTSSAIQTSQRLDSIARDYTPAHPYPESQLGRKLATVARLVASGLHTKIYYVRIDGFDTHSSQPDAHAALLREVSEAVTTLIRDANAQGFGDRLMVMGFSEFGRRVEENASEGTDHGTAGPVFLVGNQVRPGLIGEHPSLTDLDQGDLKHHTDFRQVYAALLEQWFDVSSEQVLGGTYEPIQILKG